MTHATVHQTALGVVVSFDGAERNRLHSSTTSKGEHTMGRGKGTPAFLVGASGSGTKFHVTNAGRDAMLEHLNKGVPRGYDVKPGSDLARWLVLLDEKRHGRVPQSLKKRHARALADAEKRSASVYPAGVKKADWNAHGTDFGPKVATLDRTGTKVVRVDPACSVCREPVGPGGRKTAPAKCARCYQRERRGQPEAPRSTAEPRSESVTFQISKTGREQLETTARQFGVTVSSLVGRFVVDGLDRLPA